MSETIHIFDEYSQTSDTVTPGQRHKKRMALDPMIYDILKNKYGTVFQTFWTHHTVLKETDSYLVIVERRIHPNLQFVLQNAAYFARGWGIIVICSDINIEYCKALCTPHEGSIHLLPLFTGNPSPDLGKNEYNTLLKNPEFYALLPGEHHIFLQMDTYLRKHIPEEWKVFDYIAAPYEWDESSVGGGFSYRKKQSMIHICKERTDTLIDEDAFIMNGVRDLGYKIPEFNLGITYIAESCLYEDPIGVHQWWTFFSPTEMEDAEEIFHSLLSLEID